MLNIFMNATFNKEISMSNIQKLCNIPKMKNAFSAAWALLRLDIATVLRL